MAKKDDLVVGRVAFGPSKTLPDVPRGANMPPKIVPSQPPIEVHSLLPRPGRFPVSRDYDLGIIECKVSECPANEYDKCGMPSCIKIGTDGRCELGIKAREKARESK